MMEAVFLVVGFLVGMMYANERYYSKQRKTFEQIDKEVRDRLIIAENLNKSLKDDVAYLRRKLVVKNET